MKSSVNCNFKMEMWTGGYPGGTCVADDLTLGYSLSGANSCGIHMCIQRASATAMINGHIDSVPCRVIAYGYNCTAVSCHDGCTYRGIDVYTFMKLYSSVFGVYTIAKG